MIDVKKETERLVARFISQLEALGAQMSAEAKAVSWKMAAEVIAAGLEAVAIGSLTWEGRDAVQKTKLAVPVRQKPERKKLDPSSYNAPKVHIKGPKPKERAERYKALLDGQTGFWARRDGKVKYACFGSRMPSSRQGGAVFYRMKRTDNGDEKDVKFTSIVSDWIHIEDRIV
jgi:hypothetical protein